MENQVSNRPKTRLYKTLLWLSLLVIAIYGYVIYDLLSTNYQWTTVRLENAFNADFPDDVEFLVEGRPSLPVVNVQFSASAEVVEQFTSTICFGVLRQRFDPFHSIESDEPDSESIRIDGLRDVQYTYSPNTPDTIWGNRCVQNGVVNIRVDRGDSINYVVTLQKIFVNDLNGYRHSTIECGFC